MAPPPGFRFHPTDEELVAHYLRRKVGGLPIEYDIIEIDLYKHEPWDLPEKLVSYGSDMVWYFFSPRDKKYANGGRTNRMTEGGYWKRSGKEKNVQKAGRIIGMKTILVFYRGRGPQAERTDWVMKEYRLNEEYENVHAAQCHHFVSLPNVAKSMNTRHVHHVEASSEEDPPHLHVLCRVCNKSGVGTASTSGIAAPTVAPTGSSPISAPRLSEEDYEPFLQYILDEPSLSERIDEIEQFYDSLPSLVELDDSAVGTSDVPTFKPPVECSEDFPTCEYFPTFKTTDWETSAVKPSDDVPPFTKRPRTHQNSEILHKFGEWQGDREPWQGARKRPVTCSEGAPEAPEPIPFTELIWPSSAPALWPPIPQPIPPEYPSSAPPMCPPMEAPEPKWQGAGVPWQREGKPQAGREQAVPMCPSIPSECPSAPGMLCPPMEAPEPKWQGDGVPWQREGKPQAGREQAVPMRPPIPPECPSAVPMCPPIPPECPSAPGMCPPPCPPMEAPEPKWQGDGVPWQRRKPQAGREQAVPMRPPSPPECPSAVPMCPPMPPVCPSAPPMCPPKCPPMEAPEPKWQGDGVPWQREAQAGRKQAVPTCPPMESPEKAVASGTICKPECAPTLPRTCMEFLWGLLDRVFCIFRTSTWNLAIGQKSHKG